MNQKEAGTVAIEFRHRQLNWKALPGNVDRLKLAPASGAAQMRQKSGIETGRGIARHEVGD